MKSDTYKNGDQTLRVLSINASGRTADSVTRALSRNLVQALITHHGNIQVRRRDLSDGVSFVDAAWIDANFTAEENRSAEQKQALSESDQLVAELLNSDVLVIGVPIYNFGIPASLKAWIDMVARARKTFRYTDKGPVGLLEGKKAYLLVASGGVAVDSPLDYAVPYLRHALGFLGITHIEVISAERLNGRPDESLGLARAAINALFQTTPGAQQSAA